MYAFLYLVGILAIFTFLKKEDEERQIKYKKEIIESIVGINRENTFKSSNSGINIPLTRRIDHLKTEQIHALLIQLKDIKLESVNICKDAQDQTTGLLWRQINNEVFARVGSKPQFCNLQPDGINDEGISIKVEDLKNIPLHVEKIREAFEIANIPIKITSVSSSFFKLTFTYEVHHSLYWWIERTLGLGLGSLEFF